MHRSQLGLAAAACTALLLCPSARAAAERDTVLTLGKPSGEQTLTRKGDEFVSTFKFNDRGRGPDQTARWKLDAHGMPSEVRITGKSYLKTPVDERFALDPTGHASWKNENEQGERDHAGGAFYLPASAPPAFFAVLVDALAKAPEQRLPLLPAGEARLVKIGEREVTGAGGVKVKLSGFEVLGLDYTPQTVWLDGDNQFFAVVSGWFAVVRAGSEAAAPPLLEIQVERENQRAGTLAKQLIHRPAGALLVRNARLFDPRDGSVTPGSSVLVIGNHIAGVGADGSLPLPDPVETIDANGRFLMPGLWDNHVHLGDGDGLLHLAAGVTSARDMANDETALPARVARFDRGEELGPRVLMAGFMDGRGPFAGPTKVFVDDSAEAEKWVGWYAEHGYVQIKVYSSLKPELVPTIARLAHGHGMRLSGHVPAFMTAEQFVRAGADEIQHINFVFLNFLAKEVPDTRNMNRFKAIGQYGVDIKPEGEREQALIKLFQSRHTTLDPTVNAFEDMFDGAPGKVFPGYESVVPRLPPQVARGMKGGNIEAPKGQEKNYAGAVGSMLRFLKALYDAGVPLIPGTDSPPGFGYQRELELWARAGIPNNGILRAATLGSAEVNRRAGERGLVAPGWLADFILVDGDPLQNISDMRRVRTVIKDGNVLDSAALYAAVGVQPAP